MSAFPRIQKIAALVAVTVVVIVTLVAVSISGSTDDTESAVDIEPTPDPFATPTAVPILDRTRLVWENTRGELNGAAGTATPVPCPYLDERVRESNNFLSLTPGLTFVCDVRGLQATPIAPGRVVMRVTQAPLNSEKATIVANGKDGPWVRAAAYGPFVAIDHGPMNGLGNVTSIYAGLDRINPDLRIGARVDTSTPLGRIGARMINGEPVPGVLTFELLTDDTRFGTDPLRRNPPPASAAVAQVDLLERLVTLPVTSCTLPFGNPDLNVGAPRAYRSGTHNGLDFNCGTTDHDIVAAADGEVLFVVDDYLDAITEDRDAVLANTVLASDTPFWTLAMLYGRFVVVAHHLPDTDDQIVTIYGHLSEVDPDIVTGRQVAAGTRLGAVGNTGTSAAASGILDAHSSVHLHWELHINDRAVGYLGDPIENEDLYQRLLCDLESATPVC